MLSVWVDGALYFVAGERTRKACNLAADAHCVVTHAGDEGPLPYDVYEVTPTTVFGFGMETFSPTRWRF